jgi:hypothetical protein
LIFFGCGVSAYIAIFFMERHFHIQKSIASSQLRFSAWHFQGANQRIEVSLEETTFSDSPFIQQEDRGQYDVYIAARQPAPTRFSEGEYPVMIGPFDFGRRPDVRQASQNSRCSVGFGLYPASVVCSSAIEPTKGAVSTVETHDETEGAPCRSIVPID